ncbi:MAG: HEPN domain-containing protein [Candidatus Heimdallarchaeota archaeon]
MSEKAYNFAIADEYFAKARSNLEAAKYLLKGSFLEEAINRTYYVVFHAARTILLLLGERPRSHEGTL